jgi:hypothetical protein
VGLASVERIQELSPHLQGHARQRRCDLLRDAQPPAMMIAVDDASGIPAGNRHRLRLDCLGRGTPSDAPLLNHPVLVWLLDIRSKRAPLNPSRLIAPPVWDGRETPSRTASKRASSACQGGITTRSGVGGSRLLIFVLPKRADSRTVATAD